MDPLSPTVSKSRRSLVLCLALLPFLFASCEESELFYILNPDGSGRVTNKEKILTSKYGIEGREAIAAWWEGGLVEGGPTLDLQTGEVFSVEGAALEMGSYVFTGADGSHIDHGNYMVAWSHTEDGWKIARDIWNSNMAPSGN